MLWWSFWDQVALAVMQEALEYVRDAGLLEEEHYHNDVWCSSPGIVQPDTCGCCLVEAALGRNQADDDAQIQRDFDESYGSPTSRS